MSKLVDELRNSLFAIQGNSVHGCAEPPFQFPAQQQYRDTVAISPKHANLNCHGCECPLSLYQKRSTVAQTHPTRQRQLEKLSQMPTDQRCTIMTKAPWFSQPACLCPKSCENKDARQMSVMDQETRHAQKRMLTSIGPRQPV